MKDKFKIIITLVFSYFLTTGFSNSVFLGNTPKINPMLVRNIKKSPNYIAQTISQLFNKKDLPANMAKGQTSKDTTLEELSSMPLKKINKGVYAGEKGKVIYSKYSDSQIEWRSIELKTKSGKIVKFKYSKDNPPLQEMLDIIKSE